MQRLIGSSVATRTALHTAWVFLNLLLDRNVNEAGVVFASSYRHPAFGGRAPCVSALLLWVRLPSFARVQFARCENWDHTGYLFGDFSLAASICMREL